jgi:hypothetical protein
MKKTVILSIFLLFLPFLSSAEVSFLKLRASHHPEFLRIVLEGQKSVIDKKLVYQRGQYILVSFPDTNVSVQTEQEILTFKKMNQDTIMFSPGDFRGLKVFTLEHPTRLVIDVYTRGKKDVFSRRTPGKKKRARDLRRIETVVIDPGHGGYENGIVKGNHKEKATVLDISKKLEALINSGTSKSHLTRGSDHFMTMSERVKYANGKNADVFISIHIGNHEDIVIYSPLVTDYSSGIVKQYLHNKGQTDYMDDTLTLIKAVEKAVISDFGDDMVSIRTIPHSITTRIEAAALMIEFPSFEDAQYIEELNSELANTLYRGLYIYEEIKAK